jgi:hypothetical protein
MLFCSDRFISGGEVTGIRYLIYIDPRRYSAIAEPATKKEVGRIVGAANRHPEIAAGRVIMIGPGRWGSSNIDLGINVGYADIDNASVLVELAREEAGHVPELSYGTHFFLDLVEQEIIYLPVYPDDSEAGFNEQFFSNAANTLTRFLPDAEAFVDIIKIIDIPENTGGAFARVVADPDSRRAICCLDRSRRQT